jgi:hypothetical protein
VISTCGIGTFVRGPAADVTVVRVGAVPAQRMQPPDVAGQKVVVDHAPVFRAVDPDDVVIAQVHQRGPQPGLAPSAVEGALGLDHVQRHPQRDRPVEHAPPAARAPPFGDLAVVVPDGDLVAEEPRHAEGHGLIIFAPVLMLVLSCFNLIDGIAAVANSHVFIANAHYVFGDLRAWGWITLILGVLQLLAAAGVLAGNQLARWFAVTVVGLNAVGQMFVIPAYPFWSLMIIAVDVVVLYGLCAYGSRENLAA